MDWENLPAELLCMVMKFMDDAEAVNMKAVCPRWDEVVCRYYEATTTLSDSNLDSREIFLRGHQLIGQLAVRNLNNSLEHVRLCRVRSLVIREGVCERAVERLLNEPRQLEKLCLYTNTDFDISSFKLLPVMRSLCKTTSLEIRGTMELIEVVFEKKRNNNLRHVNFCTEGERISNVILSRLAMNPDIQLLKLNGLTINSTDKAILAVPWTAKHIASIEIDDWPNIEHFYDVVNVQTSLENLSCWRAVDFDRIWSGLFACRHTLSTICLRLGSTPAFNCVLLQDFGNLERIRLSNSNGLNAYVSISGLARLPETLRFIDISGFRFNEEDVSQMLRTHPLIQLLFLQADFLWSPLGNPFVDALLSRRHQIPHLLVYPVLSETVGDRLPGYYGSSDRIGWLLNRI